MSKLVVWTAQCPMDAHCLTMDWCVKSHVMSQCGASVIDCDDTCMNKSRMVTSVALCHDSPSKHHNKSVLNQNPSRQSASYVAWQLSGDTWVAACWLSHSILKPQCDETPHLPGRLWLLCILTNSALPPQQRGLRLAQCLRQT